MKRESIQDSTIKIFLIFFYQSNNSINQKYLKKVKIDKWQEIMRVKPEKYQVCYSGHYI